MTEEDKLIEALGRFINRQPKTELIWAKVTEVGEFDCTIEMLKDGNIIQEVTLSASGRELENQESYSIIYPKVDSFVAISNIGTKEDNYVVVQCSTIDRVVTKVGDNMITISEDGVSIQSGNNSVNVNSDGVAITIPTLPAGSEKIIITNFSGLIDSIVNAISANGKAILALGAPSDPSVLSVPLINTELTKFK